MKSLINPRSIAGLATGAATLVATDLNTAFATKCDITSGNVSQGAACAAPASGANLSVGGLFSTVSNILIFLVGAISVIVLIIGGLRYVISAGNAAQIQGAKNTILYAIVGIVISVAAYAIVTFVFGQLNIK